MQKEVVFKVTPSDKIEGYWIAVDDSDVELTNGKGSIWLESPSEHMLVWWMVGNPGGHISIEGRQDGVLVVEVKKSMIPKGSNRAAGMKRFSTQ